MIAALLLALAVSDLPDGESLGQLEVRDRVLLEHAWGRALSEAYYLRSPLAFLPISLPKDRSQKLALVLVTPPDERNVETYLAEKGYVADLCAGREAFDSRLAKGGYDLAVLEVDGDREIPSDVVRALVRSHPRLTAIPALRKGTGAGLPEGERAVCLRLPLTDPLAVTAALARAGKGEGRREDLCFLIRLGSSPGLVAGGLLGALLLGTASLLSLVRGTAARMGVGTALLGLGAWGGCALERDLREPSPRLKAIRESRIAAPGVQMPSSDLDAILLALESPDPRLRREAAYTWGVAALACPGDSRRMDALLTALDDREDPDDPRQRQWAALALGMAGDRAATPRLVAALKDPCFLVRHKAAAALGQLRDPRAISPLLETVRTDPYWYNAECARAALRSLGR